MRLSLSGFKYTSWLHSWRKVISSSSCVSSYSSSLHYCLLSALCIFSYVYCVPWFVVCSLYMDMGTAALHAPHPHTGYVPGNDKLTEKYMLVMVTLKNFEDS